MGLWEEREAEELLAPLSWLCPQLHVGSGCCPVPLP